MSIQSFKDLPLSIEVLKSIKDLEMVLTPDKVSPGQIEKNILRCPDQKMAKKMISLIEEAKKNGDSLGGVIECQALKVPQGMGEPLFDKLE